MAGLLKVSEALGLIDATNDSRLSRHSVRNESLLDGACSEFIRCAYRWNKRQVRNVSATRGLHLTRKGHQAETAPVCGC